ncbi:hypothetical protein [Streptomyces sp. NPDC056672]
MSGIGAEASGVEAEASGVEAEVPEVVASGARWWRPELGRGVQG